MEKQNKINFFLLLEKRKKNKWTQADVAKRAGVSRATVNNWESGKTVPMSIDVLKYAYQLTDAEMLSLQYTEKAFVLANIELPSCFERLQKDFVFDAAMCDLFLVLSREGVLDQVPNDANGKCVSDSYFYEPGRNKASILRACNKLSWLSRVYSGRDFCLPYMHAYHDYSCSSYNWIFEFLDRALYDHPEFVMSGFSINNISYHDLSWILFANIAPNSYTTLRWNQEEVRCLKKSGDIRQNLPSFFSSLVSRYYYHDEKAPTGFRDISFQEACSMIAKIGLTGKKQSILYIQDDGTAAIVDAEDIEPADTCKHRMEYLCGDNYINGSAVPSDFIQIEFRSTLPAWETWCELKKHNPELPEPKLGSCEIWHTLTPKGVEIFQWMERNNLLSFF